MADEIVTTYSRLVWSADRTLVTKTRSSAPDARRRFRNELRINRLLLSHRPPAPTPALVGADVQRRSLTFRAVEGGPLGPKYPSTLTAERIEAVVDIADRVGEFAPRRRWYRRLNPVRRLMLAREVGLLTDTQAARLLVVAEQSPPRLRFAHGDLTARNVMSGPDGLVLIDWEWAGLYPDSYDLAFLWFSLVDVAGGRRQVERSVPPSDQRTFLLSALLIQLWHLQWYVPTSFRDRHLATRDELIDRLTKPSRVGDEPLATVFPWNG